MCAGQFLRRRRTSDEMGGTAFSAQPFWQHTHLCRSKRMTTEQERDFHDRPDEARGVRIPEERYSQEAEDVMEPEGRSAERRGREESVSRVDNQRRKGA